MVTGLSSPIAVKHLHKQDLTKTEHKRYYKHAKDNEIVWTETAKWKTNFQYLKCFVSGNYFISMMQKWAAANLTSIL
jgi:hypothetical protein